MNNLQERIKKYAELYANTYSTDLEPGEHNILTDLQATVRALEVARSTVELQRDRLYTLRRGLPSPWKNSCQDDRIGDIVNELHEALQLINQTLGKAGV